MNSRSLKFGLACLISLGLAESVQAQVHYHDNDSPWGRRAEAGPDADVLGWFYNLGITGLRAQLIADRPKALFIKYVFPKSPAEGHVEIGDLIVGAGGRMFQQPHRNGYNDAGHVGVEIGGGTRSDRESTDALSGRAVERRLSD